MGIILLLTLLLFVPFLLFLVFLGLSSCMGDRFRAQVSGFSLNPRHGSFGRRYGQQLGTGVGGWEQIEMEDIIGRDSDDD